jgi:hypothetical protein
MGGSVDPSALAKPTPQNSRRMAPDPAGGAAPERVGHAGISCHRGRLAKLVFRPRDPDEEFANR